jgi:hypothetical protein
MPIIYSIKVECQSPFPYDMLRHDNGLVIDMSEDEEGMITASIASTRYYPERWVSFGASTKLEKKYQVSEREWTELSKKADEWLVKESLKRPHEVKTEWDVGTKNEPYTIRQIVAMSEDEELKQLYRKVK